MYQARVVLYSRPETQIDPISYTVRNNLDMFNLCLRTADDFSQTLVTSLPSLRHNIHFLNIGSMMIWPVKKIEDGTIYENTFLNKSKSNQIKSNNLFHINYNQVQHIHAIKGVMWKGER